MTGRGIAPASSRRTPRSRVTGRVGSIQSSRTGGNSVSGGIRRTQTPRVTSTPAVHGAGLERSGGVVKRRSVINSDPIYQNVPLVGLPEGCIDTPVEGSYVDRPMIDTVGEVSFQSASDTAGKHC